MGYNVSDDYLDGVFNAGFREEMRRKSEMAMRQAEYERERMKLKRMHDESAHKERIAKQTRRRKLLLIA